MSRSRQTRSQQNHIAGALCGLALGDALSREQAAAGPDPAAATAQPSRPSQGPLVHGAATTWVLAVVDALLTLRPSEDLARDLRWRLLVLAGPLEGAALRTGAVPQRNRGGGPADPSLGMGATLRQVAARIASGEDAAWAGREEVRAEGMLSALPLAFALGDEEPEVARALVDVVTATHRHARVVSAAALWVGGLRRHLLDPNAGLDELLETGDVLARLALQDLETRHRGHRVGRSLEAEGARLLALAQARAAPEVAALLTPPGFDARDAPERLAVAALKLVATPDEDVVALVHDPLLAAGDGDVAAPLLVASRGLAAGRDHLPLGWLGRLWTRALVESRAAAFFDARPPRLLPLVDEELRISAANPDAEEALWMPEPSGAHGLNQEQLKLL